MRAVAFLRNLNQGQRGAPTSAQLVAAFVAAGGADVRTIRANGTVLLTADDPQRVTADAVGRLASAGDWDDIGVVVDVRVLAAAVVAVPAEARRWELSLYAPVDDGLSLPLAGRRCEVVAAGDGWALTRNDRDAESNATPTLERVLGRPVTSRGVDTVRRALAAADG